MIRINAPSDELLTRTELAEKLKRHESFIKRMKRRGFKMPGGRARLSAAERFLEKCPNPGSKNAPFVEKY